VTGCGVDETAVQVAARIAEAEQIGRGVRDRALAELADRAPADCVVVVNPSPRKRTGLVRVSVPHAGPGLPVLRQADGSVAPTQAIAGPRTEPLYTARRPAGELAIALRKGSLGLDFLARAVQRVEITGPAELTVTMGRAGPGLTAGHRSLADEVAAAGGDWSVKAVEEPSHEVYALVSAPPLGWSAAVAAEGPTEGPVTAAERRLANGLLTVDVAADGTLTLTAADGTVASGVGRLVDGGDVGDLYNYAPPPDDAPVDAPDEVDVIPLETGPLLAAFDVRRRYPWATVATRVELRAGEPFCRLEIGSASTRRWPSRPPTRTRRASSPSWSAASPARAATARHRCRRSPRTASSPPAGSRCCWTRSASTNWSAAVRSWRSRCCARRAGSAAPTTRCAPSRPAR
jgi:alpha-mannosidase